MSQNETPAVRPPLGDLARLILRLLLKGWTPDALHRFLRLTPKQAIRQAHAELVAVARRRK